MTDAIVSEDISLNKRNKQDFDNTLGTVLISYCIILLLFMCCNYFYVIYFHNANFMNMSMNSKSVIYIGQTWSILSYSEKVGCPLVKYTRTFSQFLFATNK